MGMLVCLIAQLCRKVRVVKKYTEIFKSLSDKTRLRILSLLIRAGTPLCVCEFVDSLEEPQYNISKHLKILAHAGLIEEKKDGRWVYYDLAPDNHRFKLAVLEAVSLIPDPIIAKDERELQKRFAIRIGGKCLKGAQKVHLLNGRKANHAP